LKPKIAITMGDPAGIGPELCLLALTNPDLAEACVPLVFGDGSVLERVAEEAGMEPPEHVIPMEEWKSSHRWFETPAVVDVSSLERAVVEAGTANAETARASFGYLEAAIEAVKQGEVQAVTTGPVHKEALRNAGIPFPGHTELFADRFQADRFCMMQISSKVTCSFVTVHVGYTEVPKLLSVERILEAIELTAEAMRRLLQREPVLGVCGLNPHAGEGGLFGEGEEVQFILPAMERAREQGIQVEGPLPPDTAFLERSRERRDAIVCMYHDQGHIPVKALAFDEAVNTTLGLPVIRTSVDHGTALDIAWKGIADPGSLFEAVLLAARLAREDAEAAEEEAVNENTADESSPEVSASTEESAFRGDES